MRFIRLFVLIGAAAAAAGLVLPSLSGDLAAVEEAAGAGVPRIWGTLAGWEQVVVGAAATLGLAAAAGLPGVRSLPALAGSAALGAAVLVGLAWSDAAAAAEQLDAVAGVPVRAGWGHPISLGALGVMAVTAGCLAVRSAGPDAAPPRAEPAEPGPRYLEVVIDPSEPAARPDRPPEPIPPNEG